jgi:hypothetical protein
MAYGEVLQAKKSGCELTNPVYEGVLLRRFCGVAHAASIGVANRSAAMVSMRVILCSPSQ